MKLIVLFAFLFVAATASTQKSRFYQVEFTANDSIPNADRNVELHLKPEIIDAMRSAWTKAGAGVSRSEAGFYVGSNGSTTAADRTNQDGALQFTIPAGTAAIFHTHPQGRDRMSQQDIDVANQNHIDMYVISHSGLYYYRPGMKGPRWCWQAPTTSPRRKGVSDA